MEKLVSVIVPVYNVEKYLERCLDSIICQTYKNLEIIIIDDGSTDNSYQICCAYKEKDSRVIVIQKENGGLASARNKGLEYTNGEYVGFVDSDDWIEPDTYECMINEATNNKNHIIMSGRYNVSEETGVKSSFFNFSSKQHWDRKEAVKRFLTWDGIDTSVCDKLFPASLIKGLFFPSGLVSEDVLFTYPTLMRCDGVVHIGQCKYNYFQRNGSISHSTYSEKSKGLLVYPKVVWEDVYNNLPELKTEADYYRFSRIIIYIKMVCESGEKPKEENKLIRKNINVILKNKYFSKKEKIMAIAIKLRLMPLMVKTYKLFKKKA